MAAVDYRPTRDQPFVLATTLAGTEGIQLKVGSLNAHEISVGLRDTKEVDGRKEKKSEVRKGQGNRTRDNAVFEMDSVRRVWHFSRYSALDPPRIREK